MSKFNYFKVNENILDTELKKSELWVYLTHCRHRGIKTKGYSIAGLNAVTKIFGNSINEKVYKKCINSLINKELIKIVDEEIKKGFYKSNQVIEVVEGKINIQLPIKLLDNKIITNLKVDEIKDIIKLYSLYDPLGSYGGLDYNYIHAVNTETNKGISQIAIFGEGFNRLIKNKKAYKIEPYTSYVKDELNIDMYKYINMKLFKTKPVILEYDIDDEDLTELKGEVFSDLVRFSDENKNYKYITILEENQKAIYVIEPIYPVENPKYKEYLKYRGISKSRSISIYADVDKTTRKEVVREFFYDYDLVEFIEGNLMNRKDIPVYEILSLLSQLESKSYNSYTLEELEHEKDMLLQNMKEEEQNIEDENIKAKQRGQRRRHKTSNRLKALQEKYYITNQAIEEIEDIENELMDLIPNWVIEQLLNLNEY